MNFGIEALQFYAPKTFVDQTEFGTFFFIQNSLMQSLRVNTPKDLDNFNYPLPHRLKMLTPQHSQVTSNLLSCQQFDEESSHTPISDRKIGSWNIDSY